MFSYFRQTTRLLLVASAALFLSCVQEPLPMLTVGSNQWPGYEAMYLAKSMGLYEQEEIKLVEFSSATEVLDALHAGLLDAAALTLDEYLEAKIHGSDLTMVLIFDYSAGADALLAKPEIKELADLKGKKIAVESSAVGAVMLYSALAAAGLTDEDIIKVYSTPNEHVLNYDRGLVDAVVVFEPVLSQLKLLGAQPLFDSLQVPGLIVDVLAVRSTALKEKHQQIQHLVDGYFKALAWLNSDKAKALNKMAWHLGMNAEQLALALEKIHILQQDENQAMLAGDRPAIMHNIKQLTQMMRKAGLIKETDVLNHRVEPVFVMQGN